MNADELSEQEASLMIQAISEVRLSGVFTDEEQLVLKRLAEKLDGRAPYGDDDGPEESNPESR